MGKTEVTHDTFPGCKWLGYQDSREYLGNSDDDYCLKHFHLQLENNELHLIITDETMGEKNGEGAYYFQAEWLCNWPCFSEEDMKALESILVKSIGGLHSPPARL